MCEKQKCKQIKCNNTCRSKKNRAITKAIDYKDAQLETVNSLKELCNSLNDVIMNSTNSTSNEIGCFKSEATEIADQYYKLSARTCGGIKMAFNGNGKFNGTVDVSGDPVYYGQGLGGMDVNDVPDGTITINDIDHSINAGNDISYIADKIKKRNCSELAVVDGTELGIVIDASGTINITVKSKCKGNVTEAITVNGNTPADYEELSQNISISFEKYISAVWYDVTNNIVRVIMNRGYTVVVDAPNGSFTVPSYVNNKKVAENAITTTPYYLWGYLLFYSACNTYTITYSAGLLNSEDVTIEMKIISSTDANYKTNIVFNLCGMLCCIFETVSCINMQYCESGSTKLEIKAFYSYGQFLKNLIKFLDFDCTNYDKWRRGNAIHTIESLISVLDCTCMMIESQKEMMELLQTDQNGFNCKCCK